MIGQTFGRLTVLSKGLKRKVNCQCTCGKLVQVMNYNLKSGATTSCGCLAKELSMNTRNGLNAAINRVINKYRGGAKIRALSWELTDSEANFLMSSNCVYCGSEPFQVSRTRTTEILYNGIDRVDSDLGYTLTNCVPCCGQCNVMKHDTNLTAWLIQMKKIIQYYSNRSVDWEYCF